MSGDRDFLPPVSLEMSQRGREMGISNIEHGILSVEGFCSHHSICFVYSFL